MKIFAVIRKTNPSREAEAVITPLGSCPGALPGVMKIVYLCGSPSTLSLLPCSLIFEKEIPSPLPVLQMAA